VDTNALVTVGLLPHSVPRQAFDRVLGHGKVLISSATVVELNDVIRRPPFVRRGFHMDIDINTQHEHGMHAAKDASAACKKPGETPTVAEIAAQRQKNEAARRLLQEWLADESGYDEEVWPKVKQLIEDNRLSPRRRFCD